MAAIVAPQSDRELICAGVASFTHEQEALISVADFAHLIRSGERLREAGYTSQTMWFELIPILGIRPPSELDVVTNAFISSAGCLTPRVVFRDISEAVKRERVKGEALEMFRAWERDAFLTYLVMVGHDNGCTFRKI